ncbi:MAG: lipid-A-disaccharide synthase [Gloeomargaritaceae cyanobacterium C42_A2020_066]|nr:lipid-A-disaccharide synthase [Gloeomargaritaceae cyanobacterium C42_A2020_066]
MTNTVDVVILTNGPGEVATWVRPAVAALRVHFAALGQSLRISVVLTPCPHASGQEAAVLAQDPGIDRVQSPEGFFPFLLWGQTQQSWDWQPQGLVIFLGGDAFYPLLVARHLGYATLLYAEEQVRWPHWYTGLALRHENLMAQVPRRARAKAQVIGNLVAAQGTSRPAEHETTCRPLIGLLPGSKPVKLTQGVPFALSVAEVLHAARPDLDFVIPLAPTLSPATLATYALAEHNPLIKTLGWTEAHLENPQAELTPYLVTTQGVRVQVWQTFPAHGLLARCHLCLTTVGANTAELGALGVPMLVVVPTHLPFKQMRAWGGLPGILAGLPGIGGWVADWTTRWTLSRAGLLAWPNIWAGRPIVPEQVGALTPAQVAATMLELLEPERLARMRQELLQVRGSDDAPQALAAMAAKLVGYG